MTKAVLATQNQKPLPVAAPWVKEPKTWAQLPQKSRPHLVRSLEIKGVVVHYDEASQAPGWNVASLLLWNFELSWLSPIGGICWSWRVAFQPVPLIKMTHFLHFTWLI